MSDAPMDIAKYLNAQTGPEFTWIKTYSTDGANATFFVNDFPDGPQEAGVIYRYEGEPPSQTFSNPFHVRNPRVQIIVRHPQSEIALERVENIMKLLARVKDEVLNGTLYQRIEPVGEPFEIGPDPSNRQRAAVNMKVSFYDS
jgi:hypothetical protein